MSACSRVGARRAVPKRQLRRLGGSDFCFYDWKLSPKARTLARTRPIVRVWWMRSQLWSGLNSVFVRSWLAPACILADAIDVQDSGSDQS